MARRGLLALVLLLWALAFAHDRAEDWIAATDLPPLLRHVGQVRHTLRHR